MTPMDDVVSSFNALAERLSLDSSPVLDQAGAIAAAVFKAGVDESVDAREMVGRMGPGLSRMQAARDRFRLEARDTTVSLLSFHAIVASNATLEQASNDVAAILARLSRAGAMPRAGES